MPHRFYKYKLLLDEGFPIKTFFPRLNSRFDLKHVTNDLNKSGLPDKDVYRLAVKLKRIVVTFNDKDFKGFAENDKSSGIIGVSTSLSLEQIDKELTALLVKKRPGNLYGKFIYISGETK